MRFIEKNEVLFALSYKPLRFFDPFLYFFCDLLPLMMNWFVKVATTLEVLDCVSLWRRRCCQFVVDRHFQESEIDKKTNGVKVFKERLMRGKRSTYFCVRFVKVKEAVLYILAKVYPN